MIFYKKSTSTENSIHFLLLPLFLYFHSTNNRISSRHIRLYINHNYYNRQYFGSKDSKDVPIYFVIWKWYNSTYLRIKRFLSTSKCQIDVCDKIRSTIVMFKKEKRIKKKRETKRKNYFLFLFFLSQTRLAKIQSSRHLQSSSSIVTITIITKIKCDRTILNASIIDRR